MDTKKSLNRQGIEKRTVEELSSEVVMTEVQDSLSSISPPVNNPPSKQMLSRLVSILDTMPHISFNLSGLPEYKNYHEFVDEWKEDFQTRIYLIQELSDSVIERYKDLKTIFKEHGEEHIEEFIDSFKARKALMMSL